MAHDPDIKVTGVLDAEVQRLIS